MKRDLKKIIAAMGLDIPDDEVERAEQLAHAQRDLMDALLTARREQGLTQQEIADRMGVKQSTVARLEAPVSNPTLDTLRRYAHAIGVLMVHKVEIDRGQLHNPTERDFWMTARVDHSKLFQVTVAKAPIEYHEPHRGGATFRGDVTFHPGQGVSSKSFDLAA